MEDVLDIAKKDSRKPGIYLESKNPERYPGIEQQILEIFQKQGWLKEDGSPLQKILLQSFDLESLKKFQKLSPHIPRIYLLNKKMLEEKGWEKIFQEAKEAQSAGLGCKGDLANPFMISKAHKEGLLFHFYTINKLWEMCLLSHLGADGIFTDRSDIAMSYFKKESAAEINTLLKKILKD